MTTDHESDYDFTAADFNAVYRGGDLLDGAEITSVPWDIREPQPHVVEWERSGRFGGVVLDVGCGLGDNTIFLAEQGYAVTGVDAASLAIDQARERAGTADATFVVDDATSLAGHEVRYDTILDSALYHTLGADDRRRYLAAVHRAGRPGARLNLLGFADVPGGMPSPLSVSASTLTADLEATGWLVTSVRLSIYSGVAEAVEKFAADHGMVLELDEHGRSRLPVWAAEADRLDEEVAAA